MAQKRIGMPPERLNKLIYAITSILEQKKHDTINIRKECEGALQKLENEINKVEMAEARESCFRNKFGPGNAK